MSKKSFKNNPALQFMSGKAGFSEDASQSEEGKKQIDEEALKKASVQEVAQASQDKISNENIADSFNYQKINSIGFKINSMYVETKSKRFNMLMRPSLFTKLKKSAEEKGVSVNELINIILETYVSDENKDV